MIKKLHCTTIGNLFNHTGILESASDYAEKYMNESYEILEQFSREDCEKAFDEAQTNIS